MPFKTSVFIFTSLAVHVCADSSSSDNEDLAVALTTLAYSCFVIGVGLYFTCTNPAFHTLKLKNARKQTSSRLLDFSQIYAPSSSSRSEFKNNT